MADISSKTLLIKKLTTDEYYNETEIKKDVVYVTTDPLKHDLTNLTVAKAPKENTALVYKQGQLQWDTMPGEGGGSPDELTINKNSSEELQAIGVMDNNTGNTPLKIWTGSQEEYDAIEEPDGNTLYITPGSDIEDAYVTISGEQKITGVKTFANNVKMQAGGTVSSTTPERTQTFSNVSSYSSDAKTITGNVKNYQDTDGSVITSITTKNAGSTSNSIKIVVELDGDKFVQTDGRIVIPQINITNENSTVYYNNSGNLQFIPEGQATGAYIDTSSLGNQWRKILTTADELNSVPVGTVLPYVGSTPPSGYFFCDGSSISRTSYAKLFAVIGTTYGSSDNTSFKLPDLRNRFIEGANKGNDRQSYIAPGVPNIYGATISNDASSIYSAFAKGYRGENKDLYSRGAFYIGNPSEVGLTQDQISGISGSNQDRADSPLCFNASRCSSVYGASSTVQPPAVKMLYIIKY